VQLKHTALLTGPYDWDPALVPVQEYETRLAAVGQVLAKSSASGLIVHGNSSEYGALAYLTGFVPKLGPAFALLVKDTSVRLHVSGSPTMLAAAKRLTWQKDVWPVDDLSASIRDWMPEGLRGEQIQIGLWGSSALALRAYRAIKVAIEPHGHIADLGGPLEALRLRKSPWEQALLRQASRVLDRATRAMSGAAVAGAGARSAALAAEREAFAAGAQDVRILASARNGGPPLALDGPSDLVADPLLAYLAVRFAGYWADAFMTLSQSPPKALAHAQEALAAMLRIAGPGVTLQELAALGEEHLPPYKVHPFAAHLVGNSIGLSIEEPCEPVLAESAVLQPDGVYSLRYGATSEGSDNAMVSALILVRPQKTDVLWSALGE
jgi:Xaa-Pro aminopeptidase